MAGPIVPLSQFVLKVHSRCDLACDHCYVYEAADQSWERRPKVISAEVAIRTAQRIAEHARAHKLKAVSVVLHGGEPLLAGQARLEQVIIALRAAIEDTCELDQRIHTNGVLLSKALCEMFAAHRVKVGISLDGDRIANDRHRRYADGRSSYDKVIAAIELLRTDRFRHLYAGLLCTIDTANDPLAVYESLLALDPPQIDFLLPHATWDTPPTRHSPGTAEYADWLIAIYDRWAEKDRRPVQIRTFGSILATLAGGQSRTEALGLKPASLAVIETDGSYEQVDSLKVAFAGAPETGADVFAHDLDAIAQHPGIRARQQGLHGLCETCRQCPVVASCGGGLYTHRYRAGNGFDNPSVYCADLLKLITHIGSHPAANLRRIPTHRFSAFDMAQLASGGGGAAVTQLADAQQSPMRAMLGSVYQATTPATAVVMPDLRNAWSLLFELDRRQSQPLAAVLRNPYVRAWAVRCLGRLRSPADPPDRNPAENAHGLGADLGHLAAIAAAAAVRARAETTLAVPVVDSAVHLPSLGRLLLGGSAGSGPATATIQVRSEAVTIRAGSTHWTLDISSLLAGDHRAAKVNGGPAEWQPVRMLHAPSLDAALEDTGPYRDCYPWPTAPRLTEAEFDRWQRLFREAWQVIEREHRAFAPGLAAGLTALVPLSGVPQDIDTCSAARQAPGAMALALPADPATLALRLIFGFQQVKLNAVLDLFDLYDPADDRLFPTPWREGKQHLEDLFRDAYAHLGGARFWRARQHMADRKAAEEAEQRFTRWQADTCEAIETLADSGALTQLGAQFIDRMRRSAAS